MRRLIAVAMILGGLALSGCVYEVRHNRAVTTETRTQNPDGTSTVTRTEVVREEVEPDTSVYISPWYWGWGWGCYPFYYYRPYPVFGHYGYRPYYHHR